MPNTIILSAKTDLVDVQAREQLSMLWTKYETLNDRTKRQTGQIADLQKQIKLLQGKK